MTKSNLLSNIVIFIGGAAIGAGAAYLFTKKKYEEIIDEDVASVKEAYANRLNELQDKVRALGEISCDNEGGDDAKLEEVVDEEDISQYEDMVLEAGYATESDRKIQTEKEVDIMKRPYVITPEEFDDNGYDTISLTYYADGVLTDEQDEVIDDDVIDGMVGADFAMHFGEYEDDSVFIRNDEFQIDYEILKDLRNYSEIK